VPLDYPNLLDAMLDGVIVLDADGRVAHVNAEACRILEVSAETLAGCEVERLLGPGHPLAALARSALASGRATIENDVRVERRFEPDLEVDIAVSPLPGDDDAASLGAGGVLVSLRDHTVRNSLREIVSQRDQLASYGQIAAGIAHELKNPLGGIRGAGELLKSWAKDERAADTAALIVREVDRISALVEELMVFARGDALRLESLNVHQVIDGVLELVGMDPLGADTAVERFYDPSIPNIQADRDRLTQVFLNLARNALQAMDETEGRLTVTTRMTLEHRLTGEDGRAVPTLEINVSDTGTGIPPEILDRLATPFFTTKARGTGLGLAVARHWVTRHGGALRITSVAGEGTTASVALPLHHREEKRGTAVSRGAK
jgi:two-component system nitrogen regulation sensor histidine kinase GlnL